MTKIKIKLIFLKKNHIILRFGSKIEVLVSKQKLLQKRLTLNLINRLDLCIFLIQVIVKKIKFEFYFDLHYKKSLNILKSQNF